MVSIAAFQAVDPGSIPGHRNNIFFFYLFLAVWNFQLFAVTNIFREINLGYFGVTKLGIGQFLQLLFLYFWQFWHFQMWAFPKNQNSKPSKLSKGQFLTSWNQSGRKIAKFPHCVSRSKIVHISTPQKFGFYCAIIVAARISIAKLCQRPWLALLLIFIVNHNYDTSSTVWKFQEFFCDASFTWNQVWRM